MKSKITTIAVCASLSLLASCAKQLSPDVYSDSSAGEASRSFRGVIASARDVQVAGGDKLDQNTAGIIGGGAAGALLGSTIGGGTGRIAASVAGAAAGALAGSFAQSKLAEQIGVEYTVELQNRELMTVVQGPEPRFRPGQNVLVITSKNGRTRIVNDNSAPSLNSNNRAYNSNSRRNVNNRSYGYDDGYVGRPY